MEAVAKLNNYPTSPRKMRLLADLIRGMQVEKALAVLEHNPKHPAVPLRKLVLSAINNWKAKNEGADENGLVVKTIMVDGARVIKRMRPAPQGRGYRVRKRSNHVTVVVDATAATEKAVKVSKKETVKKEVPATKPAAAKKTTKTETE
ncbi:MAG: 50S ribosomal protein L22 [Chitinophagaceae bacterium]|nr:MAG: 50S ribosomal protein L22 [Chitinophagaceae bacterium]